MRRSHSPTLTIGSTELHEVSNVGSSFCEEIEGKRVGFCRTTFLTKTGKNKQMLKMLTLTLVPIVVLIALTVIDLNNTILRNFDAVEIHRNVRFSRQVGTLVHTLQIERDMTALYISSLEQSRPGAERKIFLINTYPLTDEVLESLLDWPTYGTTAYQHFENKEEFASWLFEYRLTLDIHNTTVYEVINFYTGANQIFIDWLYEAVGKSGGQGLWETLVAYQLLIVGMEQIGIERTLGAIFYTHGGLKRHLDYLWYMEMFQVGDSNILASQKYSPILNEILENKVQELDYDFRGTIEELRQPIRFNNLTRPPSWADSTYWFDNMTIYIDTLKDSQRKMADIILVKLEELVRRDEGDLALQIGIMVVMCIMCVFMIRAVQTLTNNIQNYAVLLANQTRSLGRQRKRAEEILFQMLPKQVADQLKLNKTINAESYTDATVALSSIVGFARLVSESSPVTVVEILNKVYAHFDNLVSRYDVYKLETVDNSYMVVSGVPNRNGRRHASEIAILALELVSFMRHLTIPTVIGTRLSVRVGVHTGSVVAGIVGNVIPRYNILGDAVNIAMFLESTGMPNCIQISEATYWPLKEMGIFALRERGVMLIKVHTYLKGKDTMTTFWLLGRRLPGGEFDDDPDSQGELNINVPDNVGRESNMVKSSPTSKPQALHIGELQSSLPVSVPQLYDMPQKTARNNIPSSALEEMPE
ncbi:uncharacterized protein LOC144441347 [Glandiceps talaboti]